MKKGTKINNNNKEKKKKGKMKKGKRKNGKMEKGKRKNWGKKERREESKRKNTVSGLLAKLQQAQGGSLDTALEMEAGSLKRGAP